MHVEVITTTSFSIVSIFPSFSKLAFFDAILSCNNELITLPYHMRYSNSDPVVALNSNMKTMRPWTASVTIQITKFKEYALMFSKSAAKVVLLHCKIKPLFPLVLEFCDKLLLYNIN